jgi:hypothetical protein
MQLVPLRPGAQFDRAKLTAAKMTPSIDHRSQGDKDDAVKRIVVGRYTLNSTDPPTSSSSDWLKYLSTNEKAE